MLVSFNLSVDNTTQPYVFFELADEVLRNDDFDDSSPVSDFKVTSQLAILHQVAYIHFRQHDYVSAMKALKEVSQISEQRYGRSHLSYASALHCIGTVMFHMRNSESPRNVARF